MTWNPPVCLSSSSHSWQRPGIHRYASHRVVIPGEDQESTGMRLIELSFLAKTRNPPGWRFRVTPGFLVFARNDTLVSRVTPGFLVFASNDTLGDSWIPALRQE